VILVDRGLGLPPDLIGRMPGRTVLYSPEVLPTLEATHPHAEQRYREFRRVAPHFDHVVLHDRHGLPFLAAEGHHNIRGVVMLPYDPHVHRDLGLARDAGVTFIGSPSEHRQEWIDGLRGAGIAVEWPEVWAEAFIQALNRAGIVLNLHFTPLPNTEQRVVEALACGCFVVTEPLTEPLLFRDGEHLVVVTRETAPEVLRHYLSRPDERLAIARAGQAWVRERYSAKHCLANILALLPEMP
jgi:glycosyltransferase involved in cell wall biosynthesis